MDGEADYTKEIKLVDIPNEGANQELIRTIQIASPGTGVMPGAGETVTLSTSGLLSCVAWCLISDNAAYMEHILVEDPMKVKSDGINEQVDQIVKVFVEKSSSPPTRVYIHVDATQPAYKNDSWPAWIDNLIP